MQKVEKISGFPELLPNEQIAFSRTVKLIQNWFEKYGFVPLDTPAVERVTTLLSKGGSDHEIYGIHRLAAEHDEKKDMALRFDLTIPLARYVALHYDKLTFPFRRYHIAPVWRGERPQSGRYRQFYQCDIDCIGEGELASIHDAEIPSIIYNIFKQLNIGKFTIRINNRNVLRGFLTSLGIVNEQLATDTLRIIDKLEKIGSDNVISELSKLGHSSEQISKLLELFNQPTSNLAILEYLNSKADNEQFKLGVAQLIELREAMLALGVDEDYFVIDPKIARGLDYYTGTVYETTLADYPELGSICSGGRYENLAEKFTNKKLPGVGISIGLSRLLIKMIEENRINSDGSTVADILVTSQSSSHYKDYLTIADQLRTGGINTEIYLQAKDLKAQLKYAAKKGFKLVVIANSDELNQGLVSLKNFNTGEQITIPRQELLYNAIKMLK